MLNGAGGHRFPVGKQTIDPAPPSSGGCKAAISSIRNPCFPSAELPQFPLFGRLSRFQAEKPQWRRHGIQLSKYSVKEREIQVCNYLESKEFPTLDSGMRFKFHCEHHSDLKCFSYL